MLIAASRRVPVEKFKTIVLTEHEANYIADQVAGASELFPPRECTPEAIDAYDRPPTSRP